MGFALSLHASVPTVNVTSGLKRAADVTMAIPCEKLASTRHNLPLTASPANVSFYEEFYPVRGALQPAPAKTGALHWFASLFKKTVKRVSFI